MSKSRGVFSLIGLFVLLLPFLTANAVRAAEKENLGITGYYINQKDKRLHILQGNGHEILPPKEEGQAGVSNPLPSGTLSSEGGTDTIGWLVLYANCCTSYPIPEKLIIYKRDRIIQRFSSSQMIWNWHFVRGGTQVVMESGTVHGSDSGSFDLYDVSTGRTLAHFEGGYDSENRPLATPEPKWGSEGIE